MCAGLREYAARMRQERDAAVCQWRRAMIALAATVFVAVCELCFLVAGGVK